MRIGVALATGYLALRLLRVLLTPTLRAVVLQRPNYRSRYLPTGVGFLVPVAMLMVESLRALVGAAGLGDVPSGAAHLTMVFVALGFGALGLLDDLVGDGHHQGFAGHTRALLAGRLTTGGVKLLGGGAVAVVACAAIGDDSLGRLLVDALIVALAANLANLFDRAPGRMLKVAIVSYVPLAVVAGATSTGIGLAIGAGATAGLLGDDLRERIMLGDSGANAVGALLGLSAVLVLGWGARSVLLVVLLFFNALAERVSFSRVIARVRVLRVLDGAGRRHTESPKAAPTAREADTTA